MYRVLAVLLLVLTASAPASGWRFELRNEPADLVVEVWFDPEGSPVALGGYTLDFGLDPGVVAFAGSYTATPPGSLVADLFGPPVTGALGGIENLNAADLAGAILVTEPTQLATLDLQRVLPSAPDGVADVSFSLTAGAIVDEVLFEGAAVPTLIAAPLDFPVRECNDGIDNDTDGDVDWNGGVAGGSADVNCTGPGDGRERSGCGLGFEAGLALIGLHWLRGRRVSA